MAVPVAVGSASAAHADAAPVVTVNLTDYTGAPLPRALVQLMSPNGVALDASLDDLGNGTYSKQVAPGVYKIRVTAPGGLSQWVPGQADVADATTYTLAAGQTVSVDERLLPSGNVQISVVDKSTDAPVTTGCLTLAPEVGDFLIYTTLCNSPDGQYRYAGVPLGPVRVEVDTTRNEWPGQQSITVTAGPGTYRVALDPAVTVQTTIQAADEASTHPAACVYAVYPGVDEGPTGQANRFCADTDGRVLIGPLPAAGAQLFVVTTDKAPVYGAQWVGPNGGTGDQRQAAKLSGTPGVVTTIPPIRLDRAGSVTGNVSDDFTGLPQNRSYVNIRTFGDHVGLRSLAYNGSPSGITTLGSGGSSYTLTGLGPYAWPIEFVTPGGMYADQWSGNAPDRFSATPVQVTAGGTTRYDTTLTVQSSEVAGDIHVATGEEPTGGYAVTVRNAVTGDDIGAGGQTNAGKTAYRIQGLTSDPVLLTVKLEGTPLVTCTPPVRVAPTAAGVSTDLTISTRTDCGPVVPQRTLPPVLTSKPSATVNPSTGRSDVFAAAGADVAQRSWNPTADWTEWASLDGDIVGSPTGFANPRFGSTEVYARTSDNHLAYRYLSGSTWSAWTDLGGDVASDPTVLYNPTFGTTEVYVRTSTNHLAYLYWGGSGWSAWTDLGGSLASAPTLLYNPRFGTTEAYVRTSSNHLAYRYYGNGWSAWTDLGGDVAGTPAVFYNPRFGTTEAYTRSSAGHVAYRYWSNSWSAWTDLGGGATSDPAAVYDPTAQTTAVFATSAGQVVEDRWNGSWSGWSNLGGDAASGVAAINNPVSTGTNIYIASPDGYLYQRDWNGKNQTWSGWTNLSP